MSNHKPYTPEIIDIKMAYVTSFDPEGAHKFLAHMVAEMTTGHAADFDRAMAEHDRKVRTEALHDAAKFVDSQRYIDEPPDLRQVRDRLHGLADGTWAEED